MTSPAIEEFERFVAAIEPPLRRAMVSGFGPALGRQSALDALSWAWENWDRVQTFTNPAGYLYRVARTKALQSMPREQPTAQSIIESRQAPSRFGAEWFDPGLVAAMEQLSDVQRSAVMLVHGFGYSLREAAEVLEVAPSTVYKNSQRAMAQLRLQLEDTNVERA